jgi:hypothetical protein
VQEDTSKVVTDSLWKVYGSKLHLADLQLKVQEQEQQHHQLEIVSCSNQDPAQGLFLSKHAARNNNLVQALGMSKTQNQESWTFLT